jgi:hypothetical protein
MRIGPEDHDSAAPCIEGASGMHLAGENDYIVRMLTMDFDPPLGDQVD